MNLTVKCSKSNDHFHLFKMSTIHANSNSLDLNDYERDRERVRMSEENRAQNVTI